MSAALYTRDILRLATSNPIEDRLHDAQGSAECHSQTCGSRIIADVDMAADATVTRAGFEINACALGQASASIVGQNIMGKSRAEIAQARDQLAHYLSGAQINPGDWKNIEMLKSAKDHPGRHGAILLPFDAILAACDAAAGNRTTA